MQIIVECCVPVVLRNLLTPWVPPGETGGLGPTASTGHHQVLASSGEEYLEYLARVAGLPQVLGAWRQDLQVVSNRGGLYS